MEKDISEIKSIGKFKPLPNGSGANGSCFYCNGYVLKRFSEINKNDSELEKSINKLVGIKNDTYVFPEVLIYDHSEFYGYLMRFIEGEQLPQASNILLFRDIIRCLESVYEDTYEISRKGIITSDVSARNMIYESQGNLHIIDNDFATKRSIYNTKSIYKDNLTSVNEAILCYITGCDDRLGTPRLVYEMLNKITNNTVSDFRNREDMLYFLKSLHDYICDTIKDDNPTIKETSRFIRKRYKEC